MTQEFIALLEQAASVACRESDRHFSLQNYDAAGQWNYHAELVTFLIERFQPAPKLEAEPSVRRALRVEPCGA